MLSKAQEYRRAWPVLVASAFGSGTGMAVLVAYSLGALVGPLGEEFGWTRAQVSAASLVQSIGVVAVGTIVGGLADRFGARAIALISQALLVIALSLVAMLLTDEIWTFYAGYLLVAILGAGTLPMIWGRCIVGWFESSRGLALGLSLTGTGIFGALLPTYVSWLIGEAGWRGAFLGLAALPLLLGLPTALLFFREAPDVKRAPPRALRAAATPARNRDYLFRDALRTGSYWQMTIAFVVVSIATGGVLVHSLPMLTDRGIDRSAAAALAGLFGIAVTSGRLISGFFLDLFDGAKVAFVMFAAPAVACMILLNAGDNLVLCGAAILMVGLAAGAESDIAAYLTARFFGTTNFGAIYGLLYTLFSLGSGTGPLLVGSVYDNTGDYDIALYASTTIFLIAAVMIGLVRAPPDRASEQRDAGLLSDRPALKPESG